jgi:carbon storage regulator
VLSRRRNEQIVIGRDVVLTVTRIHGDRVEIGIGAATEIPVHRREILERPGSRTWRRGRGRHT